VAPPRLFDPVFVDTVTERSYSYRVLQPPAFVNRYAAVPSLHFGWNLLVAIAWFRIGRTRAWRVAAIAMPAAMAWAVVATANHWVFDVAAGAVVALSGLAVEVASRRYRATAETQLPPRRATAPSLAGIAAGPPVPPSDGIDEEPAHAARDMVAAGGRSP
jgi:PAP2 superfamily